MGVAWIFLRGRVQNCLTLKNCNFYASKAKSKIILYTFENVLRVRITVTVDCGS